MNTPYAIPVVKHVYEELESIVLWLWICMYFKTLAAHFKNILVLFKWLYLGLVLRGHDIPHFQIG